MVSKFAYGPKIPFTSTRLWTVKPKRWDIIVFTTKGINTEDGQPAASDPARNFVKRIVGLPGETIEIRDGWIYANGEKAEMPAYLRDRLIAQKPVAQKEREERYGGAAPPIEYNDAPYEPGLKTPPLCTQTLYRININFLGIHLFPRGDPRGVPTAEEWPYGQPGQAFTVPEGHYFVMGDNTLESLDSRAWGFVPFENIKGRVLCVWYPVYRWRAVK
jgi:signal peptidase I